MYQFENFNESKISFQRLQKFVNKKLKQNLIITQFVFNSFYNQVILQSQIKAIHTISLVIFIIFFFQMESIKNIFVKEKQFLTKQHQEILEQLNQIYENLQHEYQRAFKNLDEGKFYVNQTFIKQIKQVIEQFQSIMKMNANKTSVEENKNRNKSKQLTSKDIVTFTQIDNQQNSNPYLIDISLKELNHAEIDQQFLQQADISSFVAKNRQSSHLNLTRKMLQSSNPLKISIHCSSLTSIHLKSHPFLEPYIIADIDLEKITLLNKITNLNIKNSSVTDKGISFILKQFNELKELNISGCCLLTDQTIKRLTENKLVSLKLNELNSISQEAVLDLILHSYNLNYLEIRDSRHVNDDKFFIQVCKLYESNQANFKWLQINSNIGTDLYINKLAYLTHLTSAQSISDRQVSVLLGNDKQNINGLLFCCCQQLNQQTIELICKQIKNLKRLKLTKFTKLNDTHIREIVSQFIQLEYLNLDQCYSLTNNSLKYISQFTPQLEYLSIEWCRAINDQGLQYLGQKQSQLQCTYINISNLKFISDEGIYVIAKKCPKLKSLILSKCDQITDDSINQISSRIPNLQELVVNYCQNLTDSSLSLVSTRLRNLSRLEIQWCQVSQKCIGYIAQNLKNLKVLNLNFCPSVCDKEVQMIADNVKLNIQVLKLESCEKISEEAFLALSQSSKKLKYLDLRQCIGVTDEVIKSFCASAQSRIKFIDLSWCTKISDKALFSLSQYQHQLSWVNLSGCSQITDIGIEWIITTLKNLQYLNLSLCEKISDKSVSLISQLKKLRRLYLCDLKRITDVSISNLSDLSGLEQLHISGCSQISSSSLLAILHNLQKLSSLNINECSNIRSEFLSIMLDKIKNIRTLELSSLEIDDQFLQILGRNLQKLQYLNVSLCGKITDEGLIRLVEQIPALLKVDFQNTSITNRTKQKIVYTLNCRRMYNITLD